MKYYKVKIEYDNKPRKDGSIFVGNELYTASEMKRYAVPEAYVTPVNVKKCDTEFFFGARFGNEVVA